MSGDIFREETSNSNSFQMYSADTDPTSPGFNARIEDVYETDKDNNDNKKKDMSLRELLRSYVDDTSVHGVKNSCDRERNLCLKFIWGLLLLVALGALLGMLVRLLSKVSEHPFKTEIQVKPIDELPFPAVTICNLNGFQMSKLDNNGLGVENLSDAVSAIFAATSLLGGHLNDTLSKIEQRYPNSSQVMDMPFYNLTQMAFSTVNETLKACFWDAEELDCEVAFSPVDVDLQRCFQFNANVLKRRVTRRSGLEHGLLLLIDIHQEEYLFNDHLSAGVQVILHEPGTVPDLKKGFLASPGFSTNARTTVTKYKYLPSPFKAFGSEECVDDVDLPGLFGSDVNRTIVYTHALCEQLCFVLRTQSTCGCRMSENAVISNRSLPLCTLRDMFGCYKQNLAAVQDLLLGDMACQCPRLCSRVDYGVTTSLAYFPSDTASAILSNIGLLSMSADRVRKNYVELRIYFDDLVWTEITHVPEYTPESIIGSVGGHMGLFLGASLLSLVELLELFCRLIFRAARALCTRIHRHVMPASTR